MGRKPGVIMAKHTVVVSYDGSSPEATSLITKQAKRKPTEVVNDGGNTRLIYTFKYHASAEKAMNKIINLNSQVEGLNASISG